MVMTLARLRAYCNIYTSSEHQFFVDELEEIDAFMDELNPDIEVIWGMATDDSLDEDAKITILATGIDNSLPMETKQADEEGDFDKVIDKLYGRSRGKKPEPKPVPDPPFTVEVAPDPLPAETVTVSEEEINVDAGQEVVPDPARGFYERVLKRIQEGLNKLIAPE